MVTQLKFLKELHKLAAENDLSEITFSVQTKWDEDPIWYTYELLDEGEFQFGLEGNTPTNYVLKDLV